ncbi:MAG: SpoIID/LytB domain-containing protein [Elusimicrobia bacterium]|nr:SpoIID/LytB domain-containing protein [Elusimicrobiota bacterium]
MRLLAFILIALPARAERVISIGIVPGADKLTLACEWKCPVADADGRAHSLTPQWPYDVEATEEGLRIGSIEAPSEVRLKASDPADAVLVNKKRYRGSVIIKRNGRGGVTVVEEVGIEDYLMGVLPHEMEPSWPLEALKAQAVVARTFAYTHMGKYKKEGFDLTNDTRSQVYGGTAEESPSIRKAVEATKGEVLGFKGEILDAYYHSLCGGHTADISSVWPTAGSSPRPLKGVSDKYCSKVPSAWTAYFRNSDILAAVQRRTLTGGRLRAFSIGKKDIYGYVRDFSLKIGEQTMKVATNDLRQWLGPSEIRSPRISRIRKTDGGVEFIGKGSGHGVGLCQWGARVQAERGRTYEKILGFYFPGSTLSVIDE